MVEACELGSGGNGDAADAFDTVLPAMATVEEDDGQLPRYGGVMRKQQNTAGKNSSRVHCDLAAYQHSHLLPDL